MGNENYEKYIKILNDDRNQVPVKDELLTLSLTDDAVKKLKEIKKIMEWNKDLTLNSLFTFFFNILNTKNIQNREMDKIQNHKEIKFVPTIENEERIQKYLKENTHNSIIELSIDTYYKKLIAFNSHE
jgi:peptide methionine sulfoxide reductase MsrA